MKKGDKKGSHVEIIISFIIFVVFVIFLLAIIGPSISTQKSKKNIFESIEKEIISKTSADMTIITVNLASGGGNCVALDNLLDDLNIGENIIVKDSSGNNLVSTLNGDSLQINRLSTEDRFFKIYYSGEFWDLGTGAGCSSRSYEVGLVKTDKYIFQNKFMDLLDRDYETLKKEMKMSEGVEFGYGIVLSNGTIIERNTEDVSTNIYIRETPIEYVDPYGNVLEGYLRTKIW